MRELPRRCYIDLMTPAELAIRAAVDEVEDMPADVRLTEAVILLSQAREKVADYVDTKLPSKGGDTLAQQWKTIKHKFTAEEHAAIKKEAHAELVDCKTENPSEEGF